MEAKAKCRDVRMSSKATREILAKIKGMETGKAKMFLFRVMDKKEPVPYKRHGRGVGHKAGIAGGRYPVKVAEQILGIVENAENSAEQKGMIAPFVINNAIMGLGLHKHRGMAAAFFPRSPGESHGRRVNVELSIVEKFPERGEKTRKAKPKKQAKKTEKKPAKPAEKPVKEEKEEAPKKKREIPKKEVKK